MQTKTIKINEEPINVRIANTFCSRFKGLMMEKSLPQGEAMILDTKSIHMCFMRFPIDAVFLDKEGTVLETHEHLKPWVGTATCMKATYVIELPDRDITRLKIDIGQSIPVQELKS